jgi:hypothetical protein
MTDDLDQLSVEQLERMLLEATSEGASGRQAMARVTAIRTILRRRPRRAPMRPSAEAEENARRALELVNAHRRPDRQLDEIHPTWVASILVEPEWAPLYLSDDEMQAMRPLTRWPALKSVRRSPGTVDS